MKSSPPEDTNLDVQHTHDSQQQPFNAVHYFPEAATAKCHLAVLEQDVLLS